jgi:hypothetical protein
MPNIHHLPRRRQASPSQPLSRPPHHLPSSPFSALCSSSHRNWRMSNRVRWNDLGLILRSHCIEDYYTHHSGHLRWIDTNIRTCLGSIVTCPTYMLLHTSYDMVFEIGFDFSFFRSGFRRSFTAFEDTPTSSLATSNASLRSMGNCSSRAMMQALLFSQMP